MFRLSQTAVAAGIAATGLLFALRLLLRAIDDMTSFPTPRAGVKRWPTPGTGAHART